MDIYIYIIYVQYMDIYIYVNIYIYVQYMDIYIYISGWWLLLTPLKNDGVKVSWDDGIPN